MVRGGPRAPYALDTPKPVNTGSCRAEESVIAGVVFPANFFGAEAAGADRASDSFWGALPIDP